MNLKTLDETLEKIDLWQEAPMEEPYRQYYYIKKCRQIVEKMSRELGRPLTASTVTFGCQVNTVHETRKPPILGGFLYGYINYRGTGRKGQDGAAGHADGAFYGVSS